MKRATIAEAKEQLGALIDCARAGETVEIVDEGFPVAQIVAMEPLADSPSGGAEPIPAWLSPTAADWVKRMRRAGVPIGLPTRAPHKIEPFPVDAAPSGVVEALLEEREEGS